jgi:hypothetical protein
MGWAQVQFNPEEYDGALIGAPVHNWQEFRLAEGWDALARKKVAQKTVPITQAQMDTVNSAANAACAAVDGVTVNDTPPGGGVPADFADPLVNLITTVLDGRNSRVTDGVGRVLGREPRDFSDYARDTAASGAWG